MEFPACLEISKLYLCLKLIFLRRYQVTKCFSNIVYQRKFPFLSKIFFFKFTTPFHENIRIVQKCNTQVKVTKKT